MHHNAKTKEKKGCNIKCLVKVAQYCMRCPEKKKSCLGAPWSSRQTQPEVFIYSQKLHVRRKIRFDSFVFWVESAVIKYAQLQGFQICRDGDRLLTNSQELDLFPQGSSLVNYILYRLDCSRATDFTIADCSFEPGVEWFVTRNCVSR